MIVIIFQRQAFGTAWFLSVLAHSVQTKIVDNRTDMVYMGAAGFAN
jgi:hypothetical protein